MKTITRTIYVASDGEEFHDEAECLQYEADGCVHMKAIPNYGEHRPYDEKTFRWMMSGDGDCHYATATKMEREPAGRTRPAWATHLIYFGK